MIRDLETRDGWSEREGKWVGHVRSGVKIDRVIFRRSEGEGWWRRVIRWVERKQHVKPEGHMERQK